MASALGPLVVLSGQSGCNSAAPRLHPADLMEACPPARHRPSPPPLARLGPAPPGNSRPLTGLSMLEASNLPKAGIPFVVYERDDQHAKRKRDWNMGLHWALSDLKSLIPDDLISKLDTSCTDPHSPIRRFDALRFLNGQTGEVISSARMEDFYRVRRSKMRALLSEGIDVKWGKAISDITYSDNGKTVTAHFLDGTEDTGCLLVGADGPHSSSRAILVGAKNAKCDPIDFAATMCFTKLPRDKAIALRSEPHHPLYQCAPHPSGTFSWLSLHEAPDPNEPEGWVFFFYISYPEARDHIPNKTTAEHIKLQKTLAKEYADPFRTAFEYLPDDSSTAWYGKMRHWDPEEQGHRWDNSGGRVTLAGDAAHPMSFQRGQGLNHAIRDARLLQESIFNAWDPEHGMAGDKRAQEIQRYEDEMIQRGGKEVKLCEMNSKMLHNWEQVLHSPVFKNGLHRTD
ncbi:MAG: hypothetical protein Q9167_000957 [Letrouitia subvulpina]